MVAITQASRRKMPTTEAAWFFSKWSGGEEWKQVNRDVGGNAVYVHGHTRMSMYKLERRSVSNGIPQ